MAKYHYLYTWTNGEITNYWSWCDCACWGRSKVGVGGTGVLVGVAGTGSIVGVGVDGVLVGVGELVGVLVAVGVGVGLVSQSVTQFLKF